MSGYLTITALMIALNVASILLIAPLLDGIERKVRARVQRRVGPPILQTWYDLTKLYGRVFTRDLSAGPFHAVAPLMMFGASVVAAAVIPSFLPASLDFQGDLVVAVYVLVSISAIASFGAASSSIPFSVVGGWREASLMMASEFVLGAAVAALAASSGSLLLTSMMPAFKPSNPKVSALIALAGLAVMTYVEGSRLPFEIAEAEPELAGGISVGYGGSSLALLLHSLIIKKALFAALFLDLLVPWNALKAVIAPYPAYLVGRAALFLTALVVVAVVCSSLEAVFGRSRPGHALSLLKKAVIISGVALIAACFGI